MQQAKKQRVMYWLSFRGGLIMMKRKLTSLFLATAMVMTTLAGCGNSGGKPAAKVDTSEAAQGKVLNIYCWNQEFQERFEYFKKSGKLPSDVKVNFVVTPNENNAYQNALDAALLKQKDAPADEKVDIFLVEADYAAAKRLSVKPLLSQSEVLFLHITSDINAKSEFNTHSLKHFYLCRNNIFFKPE